MTSSGTDGTTGPRDPRGFCGDEFPWPLITELVDGADVRACYIVQESRRGETKQNKPFLRLVLGDRTGSIDGVIWEDADRWAPVCGVDAVIGVHGRVSRWQDRLQLKIFEIEPLTLGPSDHEYLLPASPRPREQMDRELDALVRSVSDPGCRKLLQRCVGRGTRLGAAYRSHPAAKRNHHAYVGGLLEHSLSVARSCDRLAAHYGDQGVRLDRDLLVTAALLHDIGKLRELRGFPGNSYTDEGKLLGHIVIGIQMVSREAGAVAELPEDRLLLLLHLIASHQGKPEWDSPRVPQMLEAIVLHYADDLDAKINQVGGLLGGVQPGEWSAYDRSLERSFFRPAGAPGEPADDDQGHEPDGPEMLIDLFRA